ncbi:MAG: bifunctional alpha,alpha-trehalose-phosphate synthase (UDP-forming)/trehalose-phosphatase [Myxococcales bacterium]|nr:bifunctional alpha,alpha-trehalose-phosphate synthase (UDP-forming)/trehalose-phosphatase [Myxococcales bacterium]
MSQRERPILIASNRLPFTLSRGARGLERKPSSGGLVSALEPVLRKRGGTWIGWPGLALKNGEQLPPAPDGDESYQVSAVTLSETEVGRYYHGFSNRTLWPLFHSLHERASFDRRDWEAYRTVNERFAAAAEASAGDADLVWIHDYHLMLAPEALRRAVEHARIAYFLHIPFPPYDVFRLLPWDREMLRGMLAADLIGFHVGGYARNFLDCVERRLGARVDRRTLQVEWGDRTVQLGAFPIGIDFDGFARMAVAAKPSPETGRERIVLGVDRLDYTKGIPERFRAFERLLELHAEHRERVVLLQLAVPSRSQVSEYRALKREIDELVGRINGRFATASWSPIRYLYRSVPQERLSALYRDADVALVTPLRDGMNLVAKEYVACQVGDPGVLVISELAGASETMREALPVNPYSIDETAEALHRALSMEEDERASRMASLRRRERRYNVEHWVNGFLEAARRESGALAVPLDRDFEAWLEPYLARYRLALFLDYDGTLTPIVDHPADATLSEDARRELDACAARPDTDVAMVSGRALEDVRRMVGRKDITYAANHGLEIEGPDFEPFLHEDLPHYQSRLPELTRALADVAPEGAWVEEKGHTATFHFRQAAAETHARAADEARRVINEFGFQARDAKMAVEARPPIGWDKGRAVLHVLRSRYGPSWSERVRAVYVGDDHTDEDAFRLLEGLAITFRVGSAAEPTAASHRLANVEAVHALLAWIAGRASHPLHES